MNVYALYAVLGILLLALVYLFGANRPPRLRLGGNFAVAHGMTSEPLFGPPYAHPALAPFRPASVSLMAATAPEGGFFPQAGEYEAESFFSDTLNKVKEHELHQLFGSAFDGNIKVWTVNAVKDQIAKNGSVDLATVKAAVTAALPNLIEHLTPFLPAFLRPFVPSLEGYASGVVNQIVDAAYKQIVALSVAKAPPKAA